MSILHLLYIFVVFTLMLGVVSSTIGFGKTLINPFFFLLLGWFAIELYVFILTKPVRNSIFLTKK